MPEDQKVKKNRSRSPNHPVLSLEEAIGRARQIHKLAKTQPVSERIAHETWGYKPFSSVAGQTTAALIAYELVETSGQGKTRKLRVSEAGDRIIRNAPDRSKLLEEKALKPTVYKTIWDRYAGKDFPADSVMKDFLCWEHKPPFNQDVVDKVIERFKATIAFAGLLVPDIMTQAEEDALVELDSKVGFFQPFSMPRTNDKPETPRADDPPRRSTCDWTIPLIDGMAVLRIPNPLTEENLHLIESWLKTMKVGLLSKAK
jgi:hypothetical protein